MASLAPHTNEAQLQTYQASISPSRYDEIEAAAFAAQLTKAPLTLYGERLLNTLLYNNKITYTEWSILNGHQ